MWFVYFDARKMKAQIIPNYSLLQFSMHSVQLTDVSFTLGSSFLEAGVFSYILNKYSQNTVRIHPVQALKHHLE